MYVVYVIIHRQNIEFLFEYSGLLPCYEINDIFGEIILNFLTFIFETEIQRMNRGRVREREGDTDSEIGSRL